MKTTYQLREVSGLHPDWLIGLPFLADEPGLGWVAITEADIDNYAGMYLRKDRRLPRRTVTADLSPHRRCGRSRQIPALPLKPRRLSTARGAC